MRRLDVLAESHPEAFRDFNAAEWFSVLEDEMKQVKAPAKRTKATHPVAVRLDAATLKRLDAFRAELERERPGASVSRGDAFRVLLLRGLDALKA
jgi:hypothetical protein